MMRFTYIAQIFVFILFICDNCLQVDSAVSDYGELGRGYRQDDVETHNYHNQIRRYKWKMEMKKDSVTLSVLSNRTRRAHNFDWACVGAANAFTCGYCQMSIMCVGGIAYLQPCPTGTTCTSRSQFSGYVCHMTAPDNCKCRSKNELRPDPYNPYAYFICQSDNILPTRTEMCPDRNEFDEESSTCRPIGHFPKCMIAGTFPLVPNCRWYYTCTTTGNGGWKKIMNRCSKKGTVFSASIPGCVNPRSLPVTDPCVSTYIVSPTERTVITKVPDRFICTMLGRIITYFWPRTMSTFCAKVNK